MTTQISNAVEQEKDFFIRLAALAVEVRRANDHHVDKIINRRAKLIGSIERGKTPQGTIWVQTHCLDEDGFRYTDEPIEIEATHVAFLRHFESECDKVGYKVNVRVLEGWPPLSANGGGNG